MKADSIDFKSERLFPFHFRLPGSVLLLFGMVELVISQSFASFLAVVGATMLTGQRGIEFNRADKVYRIYNSFLFIKTRKSKNYDHVEKIYINSGQVSQKIYSLSNFSSTFKNVEYNAYLKMADGTKIFLMSKKDKPALFKKLARLTDFFQLEITDNTV